MGVTANFFYCEALAGLPDLCVDLCAVLFPAPEPELAPVPATCDRLFWGARPAGLCDEAAPSALAVGAPVCEAGPISDLVPGPVLAPVFASPPEVLRRCRMDVPAGAGSATRRRRPAATRTPEGIPFQLRNWLNETPKRSAIVTSVSPRRTV